MTNTTSESPASSVLVDLEGVRAWQEELYRDLHRHPERSTNKPSTRAG